jgi:hypothetical protein
MQHRQRGEARPTSGSCPAIRATKRRGRPPFGDVLADVCHSPVAAEKRISIHVGEVAIVDDLAFPKWWLQFD